jgi:plasmid stabilization system protein ParE
VTFSVAFHERAQLEAIDAARYIQQHADALTAEQWLAGLITRIQSLREFPNRCAIAREDPLFLDVTLRQLLYESHRLIFLTHEQTVHVLHVRHQAQRDLRSSEIGFFEFLSRGPSFDDLDLMRDKTPMRDIDL